jgi:hypothetical protein
MSGQFQNLIEKSTPLIPDNNDNYEDKRTDYIKNEVACDYNAGFQTAAAGTTNNI